MTRQGVRGWICLAILITLGFVVTEGALGKEHETPILVQQGDFQATIFPVTRPGSAEEFYNYSIFDYQSRTSFEIPRHTILSFYRDTRTGRLSLIITHNAPNVGPSGQVRFDFEGLPPSAKLTVRDDLSDEYAFHPPTAQITWRWYSGRSDGLVITDLEEPSTITITPQFIQGIHGWKLLTQKGLDREVERVPLPNLTDPLILSIGAEPPPPTAQPAERPEERIGMQRTISTPQATPGSIFRVTIDLSIDVLSHGIGVEEQWPVGWMLEPVHNDGAIFKFINSRGQWLFPMVLKVGETKRIVYDVRVPAAEQLAGPPLPRRVVVQGAMTSASPAYTIPILGDSEIEVASCLSIPVAIAHLDVPSGLVDLRLSEMISPQQLAQAIAFWLGFLPVPGTCDAPLTSEALHSVMWHQLLQISVAQPLPPPFSDPSSPPMTITRTIRTPLPSGQVYLGAEGGNVFQVELMAVAHRDLPGLRVVEQLPESWLVQPQNLSSAFFRAGINGLKEWVFPEFIAAGQARRVVYEVTLPRDTPPAIVKLKGSSDVGLMTFVIATQGDSRVQIVECLSILMAIAHLDVTTGEIDVHLDNVIRPEQSEAAFTLWFEDREVPGTCGQKLTLEILQQVVSHMITGKPVEK